MTVFVADFYLKMVYIRLTCAQLMCSMCSKIHGKLYEVVQATFFTGMPSFYTEGDTTMVQSNLPLQNLSLVNSCFAQWLFPEPGLPMRSKKKWGSRQSSYLSVRVTPSRDGLLFFSILLFIIINYKLSLSRTLFMYDSVDTQKGKYKIFQKESQTVQINSDEAQVIVSVPQMLPNFLNISMNETQDMSYQIRNVRFQNDFDNILVGDCVYIKVELGWAPFNSPDGLEPDFEAVVGAGC